MKEGLGTVPALVVVITGFVIISSYLAFTINYSKAFKANSRIVNIIQQENNKIDQKTIARINKYLKKINYTAAQEYTKKGCAGDNKDDVWTTVSSGSKNAGWCYKTIVVAGKEEAEKLIYTKIRTFISIDLPMFNKFFSGNNQFQVEGSTKVTRVTS